LNESRRNQRRKVIVKNKLVLTIATLTLAVGLLLSVAAQNPGGGPQRPQPKPQPTIGPAKVKVNLACWITNGDVVADIVATNTTSLAIASGVPIYYSYSGGSGSKVLPSALTPGNKFFVGQKSVGQAPCQAWYFKN
jgi:hypothetical protein